MTKVLIEDTTLTSIANAIRNKNNSTTLYKPREISEAIENISSGDLEEYFSKKTTFVSNNQGNAVSIKMYLKKISEINFSGVVSAQNMFSDCILLESLPYFENFSSVKYTNYMFNNCKKLSTIPYFDTKNVIAANAMFYNCTNLISVPQFDFSNVTNTSMMFYGCSNIKIVPAFEMSNVKEMNMMFYGCQNLETLNLSGIDMSNVTNVSNMFSNCTKLTNLVFGYDLGKGFTQKQSNYANYTVTLNNTSLSHDSLISVINNLYDLNLTYDVENDGTLYTQKLVLGSANLAKLTAEELVIGTAKGWSVS